MKKMFVLVLMLLCVLASASLIEAAPKYTFKYAMYTPAEHAYSKVAMEYIRRVEEASKGQIKIDFYPNAALCSGADQFKSVAMGTVDMTDLLSDYTVGEIDMLGIGCMPRALDWRKSHIYGEKARDMLTKRLDAEGVVYLYTYGIGGNDFFLKKAEDNKPIPFKGLKTRSSGIFPIMTIKALGGNPVQMSTGEIYMSVETGLIDAAATSILSWSANNLYEVLPVICDFGFGPAWSAPVINKDAYNRLPKDLQKVMLDTAKAFAPTATKMIDDKRTELINWAVKNKKARVLKISAADRKNIDNILAATRDNYLKNASQEVKDAWEVLKQIQ
jgi:TRAP-type C4-dicarboxylate transport system substrate-binding protein